MNILDPAEDREEFKSRLKVLFKVEEKNFEQKALEALITNDIEKISYYKELISAKNSKINTYLSQWDAAGTKELKENVVSSVRVD